ncbi:MAG: hypothetical protein A2X94_03970 [Bdellovibrionales bacterium GWB1_55_8]|nr:MAG: hypothetical protein A2X94_03970 [Bdellovibrionales bacterium GWB1_55_8]
MGAMWNGPSSVNIQETAPEKTNGFGFDGVSCLQVYFVDLQFIYVLINEGRNSITQRLGSMNTSRMTLDVKNEPLFPIDNWFNQPCEIAVLYMECNYIRLNNYCIRPRATYFELHYSGYFG